LRNSRRFLDARSFALTLVAVLLGLASSACGGSQSTSLTPDEVIGTIVEVRATRGEVRAFTVKSDGELVDISIADDVDYGFDLDHLREHLTTGDPVRCTVEERGGLL
jgi:hypothetical protein